MAKQQPVGGAPHPTRVRSALGRNEIVIGPQVLPELLWAGTISDGANSVPFMLVRAPASARRVMHFPSLPFLVELDL